MQQHAIIFADKKQTQSEKDDQITVSRKELREAVKDAYQEGLDDARKKKANSATETKNSELKKKNAKQESSTHHEDAKEEAVKSEAMREAESKQKFSAIVARKDVELFRAKSVFPFDLFPDTISIDTTKITIAVGQFFATAHVTTIPLKDLADVTVQTTLFLAGVTISYMPQAETSMMMKPIKVTVTNLHRNDAMRVKNILKGVMVAKAEEINLSDLGAKEVKTVIEKFGHSEGVV